VGATLVAQGVAYLTEVSSLRFATGGLGLLLVVAGAALLAGFGTPVAGVLSLVASAGSTLSLLPLPAWSLFEPALVGVNLISMTAAVLCLGPGALSLDAHLFGRREIIIPHAARSPKG
jgi:hypothetical protein